MELSEEVIWSILLSDVYALPDSVEDLDKEKLLHIRYVRAVTPMHVPRDEITSIVIDPSRNNGESDTTSSREVVRGRTDTKELRLNSDVTSRFEIIAVSTRMRIGNGRATIALLGGASIDDLSDLNEVFLDLYIAGTSDEIMQSISETFPGQFHTPEYFYCTVRIHCLGKKDIKLPWFMNDINNFWVEDHIHHTFDEDPSLEHMLD